MELEMEEYEMDDLNSSGSMISHSTEIETNEIAFVPVCRCCNKEGIIHILFIK